MKGWLLPIALVLILQLAAMAWGINGDTLASPSDVAIAGTAALVDGTILKATGQTLWAAMLGLLIGGGIGLLLAVLLGLSRPASRLAALTVEILRPMPSVALLPVALLEFGFGVRMEAALVSFACVWPLLILGQSAIRGIDPRLLEVARVLKLSRGAVIAKIVLPATLPRLFVAFRLAAGVALIVAVTVEIAANPFGLGYGMMTAQQSLQPALALAFLVWIGIIGWGLNRCLSWMQDALFGAAARDRA